MQIIQASYENFICLHLAGQTNTLSIENLADLQEFLKCVASQWFLLGLQLRFTHDELLTIQRDPLLITQGPVGYLCRLLSQWLKWAPPKHSLPTVESLADALQKVNEERLAYELIQRNPGECGCT